MAYDAEPGGDPRGPTCPRCGGLIRVEDLFTIVHSNEDPYGHRGIGGRRWHAECARPTWDGGARAMRALRAVGGF